MIAQIGFTIFLIAIFGYALSQRRRSAIVAYGIMVVAVAGMIIVALPDLSTGVANAIGIGRGTDLLFYVFALIGGSAILNLHLRMRARDEATTKLARAIALLSARAPK